MYSFGARIKEERKRLGITQVDIAEATGVSLLTHGNYERGKRKPDAEYLELCAKMGLDVMYILIGERSFDPVLKKMKPTDRASAVLHHVATVQEILEVEFSQEQIQILMRYAYEHCPTVEGLQSFVKSAFELTGQKLTKKT